MALKTSDELGLRSQSLDGETWKPRIDNTITPASSAELGQLEVTAEGSNSPLVGKHVGRTTETWQNGPKKSALSTAIAWLKDMTIFKALLIIYCLNVVAWGGMIFLLLCNAAPAMCHPTCNDINSPRRKWIEIDSQILNALFCILAFGLFPTRALHAWRLFRFLVQGDKHALRQLAAAYRTWFRLPGSQSLPASVGPDTVEAWLSLPSGTLDILPLPVRRVPDAPSSGERATATHVRVLGVVIGLNVMNTVFQAVLSGFMWGYTRHTRPEWSVPLFLCLAFASSTAAGIVEFLEGRKVKKVEGPAADTGDIDGC